MQLLILLIVKLDTLAWPSPNLWPSVWSINTDSGLIREHDSSPMHIVEVWPTKADIPACPGKGCMLTADIHADELDGVSTDWFTLRAYGHGSVISRWNSTEKCAKSG